MTPPTTPRRADATRNRERILEVAHRSLTESGDASMNSIAKSAGVGIATIYRHFRTREELILEVYRYEVRKVADSAEQLLWEKPPLEAFRAWLGRLAQ